MGFWAAGVFLLWVGYGVYNVRRGTVSLARLQAIPPAKRKMNGTLLIFGGAAILVGGLVGIANVADPKRGLELWQWLAIAVIGIIFVHMQTLAVGMLISLGDFGVPKTAPPASSLQEVEK